MKKRIFASVVLILMIVSVTCLPLFADSHSRDWDITQSIGGSAPDGYENPMFYFDYNKGITEKDLSGVSALYLKNVAVFSDLAEAGLKEIEHDSIMYPEYKKQLEVGGIADNEYSNPDYLVEQLYRGVALVRDGKLELNDFDGGFYFTNDSEYINWDDDYNLYEVWYEVRYGFWAYVSFSVTDVEFNEKGIFMDIHGEESYRYEAVSIMCDSYPAGHDVPEEEVSKFQVFKAQTDRTKSIDETRRTISIKGAKAEFELYDINDSDRKSLIMKISGDGITLMFNVCGVIGNKSDAPLSPGVVQYADQDPGEDEGVSVPAAIVIGVLGAGAAVAGAAAASGENNATDDEKKKKTYKMYVQKDFGDAIRRGADKPSVIRARMAEVDVSGRETDRNDLTAKISASADGMNIQGTAFAGRYCETTVSVPAESSDDTASVTFTFSGEGGVFTNTVIFRVVDGPSLKFAEEEPEGSGRLSFYTCNYGIDAIPGDGFTYAALFMIEDAPKAPNISDISCVPVKGFDITFEQSKWQNIYKAVVKNNTPPEHNDDVFAKKTSSQIEIRVNVEGEKEPVCGWLTMNMYPEGITVQSRDEGKKNNVKYVHIQAYEKEYVGDLDKKWQVSEMKLTLAVKGDNKALVDPKGMEFSFEKIKGSGGKGTRADKEQSVAEKYEYKQSYGYYNDKFTYDFEPNANLCEPSTGFYLVILPAVCAYDGKRYEADIPLRLQGKGMDPYEGWDEEYKKLKDRIEKYSIPEEKNKWLQKIDELALDPRASTEQLRLTSKIIVRNYMRYWEIESIKSLNDAKLYDSIISQLEWAKFFGDCAFSFLVNAYAGPVADAILSPTKDFLAEAIGETVASWMRGQSVDFDKFNFSKNVLAAGDNLVSGNISFGSWKQAAYTLGMYFAYASLKNFYLTLREENKFDLYGSLVKGFSDMTSAGLKAAAGHLFDAWLKNNPKFRAKVSAWCGAFVSKHFGSGALLLDLRNVDGIARNEILRKYLDGLFGMAIDKLIEKDMAIHDKFIESQNGFEFDANGHLIVQFFFEIGGKPYDCSIDATKALMNVSTGLFGYVFELLFGEVPFASSVIEPPKDPPLPPANNE